MNLIIDSGNTTTKLAIFDNNYLKYKFLCVFEDVKIEIKHILQKYPKLKKAIVASVGEQVDFSDLDTSGLETIIQLNHNTPLPFKNGYKTPITLGVDRLALVSAAVDKYPHQNTLIIDAGTCITYDFITKTKNYLGGAISPGIAMRYKSLHHYTKKLPLLSVTKPNEITGNTTETAIHSGIIYGVAKEIDGVIDHYIKKHSDLTVILTGGDTKFLSDQLKNTIFANSNFLLEGLNFILEYNSI